MSSRRAKRLKATRDIEKAASPEGQTFLGLDGIAEVLVMLLGDSLFRGNGYYTVAEDIGGPARERKFVESRVVKSLPKPKDPGKG